MLRFAINEQCQAVFPYQLTDVEWQRLKDTYRVGELLTPCCRTAAIPKTNGAKSRFFAHRYGECESSQGAVWHVETQEQLLYALPGLGISPRLNVVFGAGKEPLTADIYFEVEGRRIVIGVERLAQQFRSYLWRQRAFEARGVECYWLFQGRRSLAVAKAMLRHDLQHGGGGQHPVAELHKSCRAEMPLAFFEPWQEVVLGGTASKMSLTAWLSSLLARSFVFHDGLWQVDK